MTNDAASLTRLHDIITPSPISLWPLAPGWWLLAAFLLTGVLLFVLRERKRHQANRYRREALAALASAGTAGEVANLLKRVALSAWPRTEVAALHGQAWVEWLQRQGGEKPSDEVMLLLTRDVYRKPGQAGIEPLKTYAASWIRQHRRETQAC